MALCTTEPSPLLASMAFEAVWRPLDLQESVSQSADHPLDLLYVGFLKISLIIRISFVINIILLITKPKFI